MSIDAAAAIAVMSLGYLVYLCVSLAVDEGDHRPAENDMAASPDTG